MRNIFIIILSFILSGCIDTHTEYNKSMTFMYTRSGEIKISIPHKKSPPFYIILESEHNSKGNRDILKVRWINKSKNHILFDGIATTLKFIVDEDEIIVMHPRSMPRRIGYNINDGTNEEEAIFNISRDELKRLAYAKSVNVELKGKDLVVLGHFTKYHTFRAFKKFVENS